VRDAFEDLLRDTWLVSIAFGIALGWALYQFASGVATVFSTLTADYGVANEFVADQSLTWTVKGHILTLGPLVWSTLQLAIVLGIAFVVLRRRERVIEQAA
jgi:hypothetical protein